MGVGAPDTIGPVGFLWVDIFDSCNFRFINGFAEMDITEAAFNGNLTSAHVTATATIEYFDEFSMTTTNTETFNINIDWTGSGEVYTGMYNSNYSGAGYRTISRTTGTNRTAEVSGSISSDTISVILGESSWADMGRATYSNISIYKNR